jgi:phage I-like protein
VRFHTALLSATLQLLANGRAQLLPFGEFAARDGRPGPGKKWKVDDVRGRAIAARMNAIAALTPIVIDYEHQTLRAAENGKAAPAAGWMPSVEWVDGQGLFSNVDWTAAAKAAIEGGEYRYISPVITYDDAGNVTDVKLAALTNYPAIVGMDAVVAALNAQLPHQENGMDLLQALIASLGLAAGTTQEAALSAVKALKDEAAALRGKPAVPAALVAELGLAAGADEVAALTAVKTLKTADTGTLQVVAQLQGQVAALTAQLNDGQLTGLVDGAIAANKFAPAHRDWLLGQGRKDFAALKTLIEGAPVLPGLNGQTKGNEGEQTAALTADAEKVRRAAGLTEEQWAKAAPKAA